MKPIVIKRDGCKSPFNRERIQAAVEAAAKSVDKEIAIYALNVALAVELSLVDGIEKIEPKKLNISLLIALLIALSFGKDAAFGCASVSNIVYKLCIERPNNRSPPNKLNLYALSL